ncbi:hypothetical protein NI389_00725 [Pseudoalteromonas xiamenensis]|uniref:hypothetical protein n=1 Tax=Pseudoalteromonas xiamenensis TaxID=882626 RepID=UPI0027E51127|nr:hypothetical protein [Pseudoalteromonas xiamenensis]WMN59988.1 hypothetical protein NI389_00725 [Pseudoalteromonas xiamenensis]
MRINRTFTKIMLCSAIALSGPVIANTCNESELSRLVEKIELRPANTMCGAQMSMLLISLSDDKGTKHDELNQISLDVRNEHNISVTRYSLKRAQTDNSKVALTCLNGTYATNSQLIFNTGNVTTSKKSNNNTLSLKSKKLECNLSSLLNNTYARN